MLYRCVNKVSPDDIDSVQNKKVREFFEEITKVKSEYSCLIRKFDDSGVKGQSFSELISIDLQNLLAKFSKDQEETNILHYPKKLDENLEIHNCYKILTAFNRGFLNFHNNPEYYKDFLTRYTEYIWHMFSNKGTFRVALGIPLEDGKFSIQASHGIDPDRRKVIERDANWKQKKSFFAQGMLNEKKYFITDNNSEFYQHHESEYLHFHATELHLIIAIRNKHKNKFKGCLGVLTVSSTDNEKSLFREYENNYYNEIKHYIDGIESILSVNYFHNSILTKA